MYRVTLKSDNHIHNIAFDPEDTVRHLKKCWKNWEESEEGVRIFRIRFFHENLELEKEDATCSDIGLRLDGESIISVVSSSYRFEGVSLLNSPVDTWKGQVVHGWVIVLRKSDKTFMEPSRFVGIVTSDCDMTYFDEPMVTVAIHWLQNKGFPAEPKTHKMHVSNLATD